MRPFGSTVSTLAPKLRAALREMTWLSMSSKKWRPSPKWNLSSWIVPGLILLINLQNRPPSANSWNTKGDWSSRGRIPSNKLEKKSRGEGSNLVRCRHARGGCWQSAWVLFFLLQSYRVYRLKWPFLCATSVGGSGPVLWPPSRAINSISL